MEVQVFETKLDVARALARQLETWCSREDFRSIALSGGSTPKIWFDLLAEEYTGALPWEELLFFWGDERCVPPTHPESNYGMTRQHLLDKVPVPENHVFRIRGEDLPGEEASRYGTVLLERLPVQKELPRFDLVVLGMGDDGHTASIFPHEMPLWNAGDPCVVATHPESGQRRISITGGVINNARQVVFLVTGANKASRIRQIQQRLPGYEKLPASRVSPGNGRLLWMLDREAASELS
ncbi:MAG: 6-phosphogluconolactonase [Bacteroidetes bacterium]|jgi:6-phosphogluconolactonase|nr:MAG: 6-phosphogluconolactonase [Bacteroidota bacterium]UCE69639.1 MAG: 6-phosphogluconolactonase [Flavobacteriaceae bacterium]